jgi:hypothetical protein
MISSGTEEGAYFFLNLGEGTRQTLDSLPLERGWDAVSQRPGVNVLSCSGDRGLEAGAPTMGFPSSSLAPFYPGPLIQGPHFARVASRKRPSMGEGRGEELCPPHPESAG